MTLSDFKIFDSLVREVACDVLERKGFDAEKFEATLEICSHESARIGARVARGMARRYAHNLTLLQFFRLIEKSLRLAGANRHDDALLAAIKSVSPILGVGRKHRVTLLWLGNAMGERARLDAAA